MTNYVLKRRLAGDIISVEDTLAQMRHTFEMLPDIPIQHETCNGKSYYSVADETGNWLDGQFATMRDALQEFLKYAQSLEPK